MIEVSSLSAYELSLKLKSGEISSIEHGLAEAIKNLKAELIEKATGKSESFIRKCSDPDLDQQLVNEGFFIKRVISNFH